MSYAEQNLTNGEKIVYQTKLHWIKYWKGLFLIAVAVLAITNHLLPISALFGVVGALALLSTFIQIASSEFAITDRRVLVKVGLIRRRTLELYINRIEATSVDQSLFGRIFGYGTLIIAGTGGDKEHLPSITAPLDFRKKLQEQLPSSKAA